MDKQSSMCREQPLTRTPPCDGLWRWERGRRVKKMRKKEEKEKNQKKEKKERAKEISHIGSYDPIYDKG